MSEIVLGLLAAAGAFLLLKRGEGGTALVPTTVDPSAVPGNGQPVPVQNTTPPLPGSPPIPTTQGVTMPKITNMAIDATGVAIAWSGAISAVQIDTDHFTTTVPVGALIGGHYSRAWLDSETFVCARAIDANGVLNNVDYLCNSIPHTATVPVAPGPPAPIVIPTLSLSMVGDVINGWNIIPHTNVPEPFTTNVYVGGVLHHSDTMEPRCLWRQFGIATCSGGTAVKVPGTYDIAFEVVKDGTILVHATTTVVVPAGVAPAPAPVTLPPPAPVTVPAPVVISPVPTPVVVPGIRGDGNINNIVVRHNLNLWNDVIWDAVPGAVRYDAILKDSTDVTILVMSGDLFVPRTMMQMHAGTSYAIHVHAFDVNRQTIGWAIMVFVAP